jgi:formylglycine-generating enzyme required for sulfatase activity
LIVPGLDREDFLDWYRRNRIRSRALFDCVSPNAYYSRPIPLRHPPVFYEGHLPAFSFSKLVREALGEPSIDPNYEKLFERGIDPSPAGGTANLQPPSWPSRAQVQAFGAACDAAVEDALRNKNINVPGDARLHRAAAVWTILEHEPMHHETFAYILHRMPFEEKQRPEDYTAPRDAEHPALQRVEVGAGTATLGARRDEVPFGWDNEFDEIAVEVDAFECDVHPVTNRQWMNFVRDGGPVPAFWAEEDGKFKLLGAWEILPMLESAPVWVTNEQARAYASWCGRRVMTEAEYHRAAFGTPEDFERAYPWGDDPPGPGYGNFDWQSWDVQPVGSAPLGASAWGIHGLVGNGWEHTSTPFGPFPGFQPAATYPPYSNDFFDGKHYVVKGASPVTCVEHIRRSFRNWYYADYPYVYAKFRTVIS